MTVTETNLEYDLKLESREGYLFAGVHTVELTTGIVGRLLRDIRKAVIDTRHGRLMLELDVGFTISEAESLQMIKELRQLLPGIIVAFVATDRKHDTALSIGTGFALFEGETYQYFPDPDTARSWLIAT